MADEYTRADSVRLYLTGASSHEGTQTDPDASLGNYNSAIEWGGLSVSIASAITNLTVEYLSPNCGAGAHTLTAASADSLTFAAAGGSTGSAVTIANGETKIIEDGSDPTKYVRVTRTSASDMTGGPATLTASIVYNNVIGFDNVSSAEASAGDDEYRCFCVRNEQLNDLTLEGIKVWIKTIGTQRTSDGGQLGASGSGSITTTGSFSDWPESGFAHIKTSGGTTREIVYFSSRTDTVLTVPTAGRGLLGTSAAAGASDDTVDSVPGIRVAVEWPTTDHATGAFQDKTGAGEGSAPTVNSGTPGDLASVTNWSYAITETNAISVGTRAADEKFAIWIHREIIAGTISIASMLQQLHISFDSN